MANEPIDIFAQPENGGNLPPTQPPPVITPESIKAAPGATPIAAPSAQQHALSSVEEQELFGQDKMSGKQVAIVIIVGVIVLTALGGGGYFVYQGITSSGTLGNSNMNNVNTNPVVNQTVNQVVNTTLTNNTNPVNSTVVNTNTVNTNTINTNTSPNTNQNADPDGDGLTNAQEATHGTNPKKADSDGDGFLDGDEVQNGYNPLGPGKL